MKEEIEAACQWWSEALDRPGYRNGDDTAGILMHVSMAGKAAPEDKIKRFGEILAEALLAKVAAGRDRLSLDVDYGPCEELASAARGAGINSGNFPWKTIMHISPGEVTVRCGYGAETRYVYGGAQKAADADRSTV